MPRRRKWRPFLRSAICEWCGKKYEASREWQRFDSKKCQQASAYKEAREGIRLLRNLKSRKTD